SRMQQVNENAVYLQCAGDIKDHSFVKSTVDDTISHFNKVDILVNNAGTCCRDNLEQITEEQWDRDMNTNAKAAFLFIKACVYPHMKEEGYGRIINISSVS